MVEPLGPVRGTAHGLPHRVRPYTRQPTRERKIELAHRIVELIVGRAHRRLRDHNGLTLTCGAQALQRLLVGRSLAR